ncbi:HxlR family transcriptional regulator [Synergistales bacterium]|nr:HxlR family transcriptional regulator [Synergistales bacterium]
MADALKLIGGKWKIPILCVLHRDGTARYGELKRKLRGITNTMLASSLRDLEKDGLVSRTQYMEMPMRVEYSLMDACGDLIPILLQLAGWGAETHQNAPPARRTGGLPEGAG